MPLSSSAVLAASLETGALGIYQIKRLWSKLHLGCVQDYPDEAQLDASLIQLLGIGLLPLYEFVYSQRPDFAAFEAWIASHHTAIPVDLVRRCNALITREAMWDHAEHDTEACVLTEADLEHWDRWGYVIIRQAVPVADCAATRGLIWETLGMQKSDPASWYRSSERIQGIMVTLYNHPVLLRNRQNTVIRKAYEQLWGTPNLLVTADKVGFNPPETDHHRYRGAGMHWDVSLARPIPFGTQGILYLTDTAENGGALRLVPGFHRSIDQWLDQLPAGKNPRLEHWEDHDIKHIAAQAGDFIIWHHALPHDSSPNTAATPRLVQYFNWFNPLAPVAAQWL
jgi:hypothetical protein